MAGTGFAGVRGSFWSAGVPEEASLTGVAVTAICVVAAFVTHASTPSPRRQPQSTAEMAALGVSIALALLALMWRPSDAVGCLPGLIIVERGTALAVVAGCVVSAHTLPVDHAAGLLLGGGFVVSGWYTIVSVTIAKATSFNNKIIDGIMVCGENACTRMFGLAGTRLLLEKTDSQVGDHELVLGSWSKGIHRVPG